MTVAACGGSPTEAPAAGAAGPPSADKLQQVYSQVTDSDVQARRTKLKELTKAGLNREICRSLKPRRYDVGAYGV